MPWSTHPCPRMSCLRPTSSKASSRGDTIIMITIIITNTITGLNMLVPQRRTIIVRTTPRLLAAEHDIVYDRHEYRLTPPKTTISTGVCTSNSSPQHADIPIRLPPMRLQNLIAFHERPVAPHPASSAQYLLMHTLACWCHAAGSSWGASRSIRNSIGSVYIE